MDKNFNDVLFKQEQNYIFPFLWIRNESDDIIAEEIQRIYECGIKAVCVEGRPYEKFGEPEWWSDIALILEECKKRDMKVWILDDKQFPTGFANDLIPKKYPHMKMTSVIL